MKLYKKLVNSEEKKRLLSNFLSLSTLQGLNYILPLITFPYLVKTLGVELFGILAFATALITYFNIITDYGFNLTATKKISEYSKDREKLSEIFSSVITIKIIFMLLSFCILIILCIFFDKLNENYLVYIFSFGIVIGQILFPAWFFQGMQDMKYITYLQLLSKTFFVVMIFVFIQSPNDFYLVPLFTSMGYILAGILSLVVVKIKYAVSFQFQTIERYMYYLKDGWNVFISRIYANLYTTTNIVLLGVLTNDIAVGYYSIVEKIVVAIGGFFEPANQALYPYLVKKYKENFHIYVKIMKKLSLYFLLSSIILFILSEVLIDEVVFLVTNGHSQEIILLLSIFLLRVISYPFGSFFSNSLIIMNRSKELIKVMNYTVLINLLLVPISIILFNEKGLVISFLVVLYLHVFLLIRSLMISIKDKG